MTLKIQPNQKKAKEQTSGLKKLKNQFFSKDYVDFLNDAGWRLEKKFPSNNNQYSDLLEDTDWKNNNKHLKSTKHYRRDLDAMR